ncbi:DNA-binding protein [Burkholderia sp. RS02]|uniref:DNA-binding protein n=1 Tax=unclassified Burkholderia TaxID=2613784 RepID=UPI003218234D
MDQLLSAKPLAAVLGDEMQTTYNRSSGDGNLPRYMKRGILLRFRSSDVEAWLTSQQPSPGQQTVVTVTPAPRRRGRRTKAEQVATRRSH